MKFRLTIALIIQIVAILFSLNGWIDALQGGAAVVIVALLTVAAWALGRVRLPVLTWGSLLAATATTAMSAALFALAHDAAAPDPPHGARPRSGSRSSLARSFTPFESETRGAVRPDAHCG